MFEMSEIHEASVELTSWVWFWWNNFSDKQSVCLTHSAHHTEGECCLLWLNESFSAGCVLIEREWLTDVYTLNSCCLFNSRIECGSVWLYKSACCAVLYLVLLLFLYLLSFLNSVVKWCMRKVWLMMPHLSEIPAMKEADCLWCAFKFNAICFTYSRKDALMLGV